MFIKNLFKFTVAAATLSSNLLIGNISPDGSASTQSTTQAPTTTNIVIVAPAQEAAPSVAPKATIEERAWYKPSTIDIKNFARGFLLYYGANASIPVVMEAVDLIMKSKMKSKEEIINCLKSLVPGSQLGCVLLAIGTILLLTTSSFLFKLEEISPIENRILGKSYFQRKKRAMLFQGMGASVAAYINKSKVLPSIGEYNFSVKINPCQ